jgi:hypothetical protein
MPTFDLIRRVSENEWSWKFDIIRVWCRSFNAQTLERHQAILDQATWVRVCDARSRHPHQMECNMIKTRLQVNVITSPIGIERQHTRPRRGKMLVR